jgi:hypothetical protein
VQGKTISGALPTPAAVRKAEQEIAEFRKYQELSRTFVEINEKICRLRASGTRSPGHHRKKGPKPPARKLRAN